VYRKIVILSMQKWTSELLNQLGTDLRQRAQIISATHRYLPNRIPRFGTHWSKGGIQNEYEGSLGIKKYSQSSSLKEPNSLQLNGWYSIKPLQNGIPSLVDLLEVSVENLQTLFMNAGVGLESLDNATNYSASNHL
jgi:hypothetical protein